MYIDLIFLTLTAGRASVSSSAGDNTAMYDTVEDRLRKSVNTQRKIKESQLKMTEVHQKIRDLSINIRYDWPGNLTSKWLRCTKNTLLKNSMYYWYWKWKDSRKYLFKHPKISDLSIKLVKSVEEKVLRLSTLWIIIWKLFIIIVKHLKLKLNISREQFWQMNLRYEIFPQASHCSFCYLHIHVHVHVCYLFKILYRVCWMQLNCFQNERATYQRTCEEWKRCWGYE